MKTKTMYEEQILKEVQDLPQPEQKKMARIVRFLKKEIIRLNLDEKNATENFLSACGTWEDDRTVDEQIKDIYSSRKSIGRTEEIF